MTKPTLVVLAAGMGSRYGGLKQVDPVGPGGETLMDYAVYDALQAGFGRIVFVIRREFGELFRASVGARYTASIPVDYVYQALDDLPPGLRLSGDRTKPWGTAHAVRAARDAVREPFAAINADDFYSRDAFVRLAGFLTGPTVRASTGAAQFAMVGFRLRQTLSEHGSVARGVCRVTPEGRLQSVREMTRLVALADGRAENREIEGQPEALAGDELVSLNMWGFTPALFAFLEPRFAAWLAQQADNPKAEWYLPFVVDELIRSGEAEVQVLPTGASWFGVTYREDKPRVTAAIAELVAGGHYPSRLWS